MTQAVVELDRVVEVDHRLGRAAFVDGVEQHLETLGRDDLRHVPADHALGTPAGRHVRRPPVVDDQPVTVDAELDVLALHLDDS